MWLAALPLSKSMFCECGCGQKTPLARQSDTNRGWVRGKPIRFVNGHNKRLAIRVDPNNTEKICTGCGELKPIAEFHKKSAVPHGRKARCRDCEAESQA